MSVSDYEQRWHSARVRLFMRLVSGGGRFATTPGYWLAPLTGVLSK